MSGDFRVERYTSPGGPPVEAVLQGIESSSAPTLRSLEGEVARLTKTNFNLKLRIYYLEERLARLRADGTADDGEEALSEELIETKMLLEEKSQQLEERNMLLVKARNAIESLQSDLEFARTQAEEARRSGPALAEDLVDRERIISEMRREFSQSEGREHSQRRRVESLESTLRQIQTQLEKSEVEVERLRTVEATIVGKDDEIKSLHASIADLRETLASKSGLEVALSDKSADIEKVASERDQLRQQVMELTQDVGAARGTAEAIQKQAADVAKLEAQEIAKLQSNVQSLQEQVATEQESALQAAKEVDAKVQLLAQADRNIKVMENQIEELSERLHKEQSDFAAAKATAREREAALHDRLKEATTRESNLQTRSVEAGSRETDLVRKLADVTGQVSEAEGQRHASEEREREVRRELKERNAELHALERQLADQQATMDELKRNHASDMRQANDKLEDASRTIAAEGQRRQDQVQSRVRELELELEHVRQHAREREEGLQSEVRHWEQHVRSNLIEFFGDASSLGSAGASDSAAATSALASSISFAASGERMFPPPSYGGGEPSKEDLVHALRRLPRLRRWFEDQARAMQKAWSSQMTKLDDRTRAAETRVADAEAAVRPALVAVKAIAVQRRDAERRAAQASEEKGVSEAEASAMSKELTRLSSELRNYEVREREYASKVEALASTNRALLQELDEKREAVDSSRKAQVAAHREKADILESHDQMRRQVQYREHQLKQHMAMLESQLSALGDAHKAGARGAEQIIRTQVMRTQALINSSGAVNGGFEGDGPAAGNAALHRAMMEELEVHMDRTASLLREAEVLESKTRSVMFETRTTEDDVAARQLLDANAQLTVSLKALGSDLKVCFAKLNQLQKEAIERAARWQPPSEPQRALPAPVPAVAHDRDSMRHGDFMYRSHTPAVTSSPERRAGTMTSLSQYALATTGDSGALRRTEFDHSSPPHHHLGIGAPTRHTRFDLPTDTESDRGSEIPISESESEAPQASRPRGPGREHQTPVSRRHQVHKGTSEHSSTANTVARPDGGTSGGSLGPMSQPMSQPPVPPPRRGEITLSPGVYGHLEGGSSARSSSRGRGSTHVRESFRGSETMPAPQSKQRRMEQLHQDMVARLSKIGVDLSDTATQISHFGSRRTPGRTSRR